MPSIALLAVSNCLYSSITGPVDCLSVASSLWQAMSPEEEPPLFRSTVVAPGGTATAFNGTVITADDCLRQDIFYDLVYVPVIFGELAPLLADAETIGWLARQGEHGACLCSVCAGAFLIAQTGRLHGRRATTHWNLADRFAERFPEILLKREMMLIDEGDCITAGGVSAYLDLTLYLAGRFGSPELAAALAKFLLIDPARRLQTPYQSCSFRKNHGDRQILLVQDWLEANLSRAITIGDLAGRAGLGERTFMRRFKRATGETPLDYLRQLRIETARKLLESTAETIDEITRRAGYEDISSFRKLFKRTTGLSPSAYRRRFSCLR